MSFESSEPKRSLSKEEVKIRLGIQNELVNQYYGFDVNDVDDQQDKNDYLMRWFGTYADDYEQAYEQVAQEHDIVELYKNDPEEAVRIVDQKLEAVHQKQ